MIITGERNKVKGWGMMGWYAESFTTLPEFFSPILRGAFNKTSINGKSTYGKRIDKNLGMFERGDKGKEKRSLFLGNRYKFSGLPFFLYMYPQSPPRYAKSLY